MEKIYTLVLLPVVMIILSCSYDALQMENATKEEQKFKFSESRSQWNKLKKQEGNSYTYSIEEISWTGAGSETTIVVQKGKVVKRTYLAFVISETDGEREVTDSYEESAKKEIGTHALGAPAYTIDDLYRLCISKYLKVDENTNEIFFETNEEGMMTHCGFVPLGCQDDCFQGFSISNFSWN